MQQTKVDQVFFFTTCNMVKYKNPPDFYRDSSDGPTGFANWPGPSGRSRVSGKNHQQSWHGRYRLAYSHLCKVWQSLSIGQKDDWALFSDNHPTENRYGDIIVIGGFQWFVRLNSRLILKGLQPKNAPPANDTPAYNPSFNVVQETSAGALAVQITPAPAGDEFVFYSSSLNRPVSQVKPVNTFRTGGFFDSSSTAPYTVAQSTEVKAGDFRHKFSFFAVDGEGKSPGLVYDDIVGVTTP